MKKNLKKIEKIILIIAASLYSATPVFAQTNTWSGECVGGAGQDVATIKGIECLIANILTVAISLIGMVSFLMFIIGSVMWLVSGGSPEGTKKARDTLLYAVIGIAIALSAFIALNLIAGFTGVDTIKEFIIPSSNS